MVKKLEQAACAEDGLSRPVAYRNIPEGFLDFSSPPGLFAGTMIFFF